MNVNPAELRRIADKLDGALERYRAAHYRYPTVPNHVETAFLSIADDLDDLLAHAPSAGRCWCGSVRGPRHPADADGNGCLANIYHHQEG